MTVWPFKPPDDRMGRAMILLWTALELLPELKGKEPWQ
jgi:hypothetical protein